MTGFENLELPRDNENALFSIEGNQWRAVGWERHSRNRKLVLNTDAFLVEIVEHGRMVQWNKHLFLTKNLCADAYGEAPCIEEAAHRALDYTIPSEESNGLRWYEHAIDITSTSHARWVAAIDAFVRAQVMRCPTGLYEAHVELMGIREFFGVKHIVTADHIESKRRFTSFDDAAKECIELAARAQNEPPPHEEVEGWPAKVVPLPRRAR